MIKCNSIEEVRENINQIDEEIVKLKILKQHQDFVENTL